MLPPRPPTTSSQKKNNVKLNFCKHETFLPQTKDACRYAPKVSPQSFSFVAALPDQTEDFPAITVGAAAAMSIHSIIY